jgi:hypothetical protein
MDRKRMVVVAAVALLLALPAAVFAGGMRRGGGPGGPAMRGGGMAPAWDKAKEVTLRGTVVEPPTMERGRRMGSAMTVRTEGGEVRTVLLGPPWFVSEIGLKPAAGNAVEVIGMPVQAGGQELIVAREAMWNGARYQLRNAEGAPVWMGGGSPQWQRYGELWDSGTKETVTGQIEAVEEMWPGGREAGGGVTLRLKTRDGKQVQVHLGPAWFVEEQLPDLKAGQQVTVSGSAVKWQDEQVLIAGTVEREGKTVRLRDEEGTPQWAGGWRNWGGWGPGSRYGRLYNPATVKTVTGKITKVEHISPMRRLGQGLMIVVRTSAGTEVPVHVGPAWYMEQVRLAPKVGDEVSVSGSMVELQGQQVMLASAITWHDEHIDLRTASGQPVWAGRGMARR